MRRDHIHFGFFAEDTFSHSSKFTERIQGLDRNIFGPWIPRSEIGLKSARN